jgi:hypothetical protein
VRKQREVRNHGSEDQRTREQGSKEARRKARNREREENVGGLVQTYFFKHLEELKNFNGLIEIRAALDSNPVSRMKETMAVIPK